MQLRYLEPDRIRRWYSTVLSEDRPTQRKHAYSLLRSILREAEDEGLIDRNPCRVRNAGRVRRTRDIEPATPAELNRLLELPPRQGLPVLLAGWCGLRAGEVRGLRRRDLDLTEGVVRVRQAVTRTKGQVHVGAPKTAADVRDVGIPPHLIPYLAKYVAALPVTGRDGFLFPGGDGVSPMSEKALRYAYGKARKLIGREDLTFHDMRHSAASLAGMTGATTAELKAMMGHATAGMVERYQHATRASRSRLAENMSKLVDQDRCQAWRIARSSERQTIVNSQTANRAVKEQPQPLSQRHHFGRPLRRSIGPLTARVSGEPQFTAP